MGIRERAITMTNNQLAAPLATDIAFQEAKKAFRTMEAFFRRTNCDADASHVFHEDVIEAYWEYQGACRSLLETEEGSGESHEAKLHEVRAWDRFVECCERGALHPKHV